MMCSIDGEGLLGHTPVCLVRNLDRRRGDWTLFVAVLIEILVALLHDRFQVLINRVNGARGVHPATMLIEALIDKELAPRDSAVSIQSFVAYHLQFRSEIEGRVRID